MISDGDFFTSVNTFYKGGVRYGGVRYLLIFGRYSIFQSPNGDVKIQFLVENTTVTVIIQKFDYGITVIFEKINSNTVI